MNEIFEQDKTTEQEYAMKERIVQIMNEEGLSSSKFAEEIGIQRAAMSHIISGRNNPSLDIVRKILQRFTYINPDWMLFNSGPVRRNQIADNQSAKFAKNTYADDADSTTKINQKQEKITEQPAQQTEHAQQIDTSVYAQPQVTTPVPPAQSQTIVTQTVTPPSSPTVGLQQPAAPVLPPQQPVSQVVTYSVPPQPTAPFVPPQPLQTATLQPVSQEVTYSHPQTVGFATPQQQPPQQPPQESVFSQTTGQFVTPPTTQQAATFVTPQHLTTPPAPAPEKMTKKTMKIVIFHSDHTFELFQPGQME